jgi:hypothetical protein
MSREKNRIDSMKAKKASGSHQVIWDATGFPSGIYYYRLSLVNQAGNESSLSTGASAVSDRVAPRATAIEYTPIGRYDPATGRMSVGLVNVRLTVNKPLQSLPFLSITPVYLMITHSVRFFVDIGVERMAAAFFLATVGIVSLVSESSGGGSPTA